MSFIENRKFLFRESGRGLISLEAIYLLTLDILTPERMAIIFWVTPKSVIFFIPAPQFSPRRKVLKHKINTKKHSLQFKHLKHKGLCRHFRS